MVVSSEAQSCVKEAQISEQILVSTGKKEDIMDIQAIYTPKSLSQTLHRITVSMFLNSWNDKNGNLIEFYLKATSIAETETSIFHIQPTVSCRAFNISINSLYGILKIVFKNLINKSEIWPEN